MPGGVPMSWMAKWPGPFPVFVAEASGAHFRDVDGHDYVDLCLGDTGAMTGHSPQPTVEAVRRQVARGITSMLPTEDAVVVATELGRRFGLPLWQFTLSATDANRHADALRPAPDRPAARSSCTTSATTAASTRRSRRWTTTGRTVAAAGQHRPAGDPAETTIGRASSTTSTRWSRRSRPATSRPSCASPR